MSRRVLHASPGGGTFFRFTTGTKGMSGRHVAYIARERAVLDREAGVLLHNLPPHIAESRGYEDLRASLIAHAAVREEVELVQHRSRGEARTHYRVLMSFEQEVSTGKALAMAKEWLTKEMPKARGFAVVHRDTEHTHVHVWIDSRQIDGRKIQLSNQRHRRLDESWSRIYSRELGRDPLEHERKKLETSRLRGPGSEQGSRSVDRIHRQAAELEPHFQRREVGVYAARHPGAERAGETFLEHVRAVAVVDLQEARSWQELERRLRRHGLRIETRGAGMVITDGRRQVKASAVERSASRQSLERRFQKTLREHLREKPKRERLFGNARAIRRDLYRLERREWLQRDLAHAVRDRDAARSRVERLAWKHRRADAAEQALARGLAGAYRDPERARAALQAMAEVRTPAAVAEELRRKPDRLGELMMLEQRRFLLLKRAATRLEERQRVAGMAELARSALELGAGRPSEFERVVAERQLRSAEQRVHELETRIAKEPTREQLLVRIGARRMGLERSAVDQLGRILEKGQREVVDEAGRTMRRVVQRRAQQLARTPTREVVGWITAPRRQIPRSIVRAFRQAMRDNPQERGVG